MVQAVPRNSFPTFTRPNYGEIYIKIPDNSEDHTEEPRVFNKKLLQLHFTTYLGHFIEERYTKNPLMPKDHTSMDHEFCNRQVFFLILHVSTIFPPLYRGNDKSLARPGRKQATATEDFDFHISYL